MAMKSRSYGGNHVKCQSAAITRSYNIPNLSLSAPSFSLIRLLSAIFHCPSSSRACQLRGWICTRRGEKRSTNCERRAAMGEKVGEDVDLSPISIVIYLKILETLRTLRWFRDPDFPLFRSSNIPCFLFCAPNSGANGWEKSHRVLARHGKTKWLVARYFLLRKMSKDYANSGEPLFFTSKCVHVRT